MKGSWKVSLGDFVEAARGKALADLVFRNARVVNVLTGEIHGETVESRGTGSSASGSTGPPGRRTRSTSPGPFSRRPSGTPTCTSSRR